MRLNEEALTVMRARDDREFVPGVPRKLKHKLIRLPELDTTPPPGRDWNKDTLYADVWRYRQEEWADTARTYEANPRSFHNAWHYLNNHPIYWRLKRWAIGDGVPLFHARHLDDGGAFNDGSVWSHVARVNPETGSIHEDKALNTRTEVWLETGEWSWPDPGHEDDWQESHYHNPGLDRGAASFEEAVVRMAHKVWKAYGNDRRRCAPQWHQKKQDKADKRIKKNFGPGHGIARTRPYGHMCAHEERRGIAGVIDLARFIQWRRDRDRYEKASPPETPAGTEGKEAHDTASTPR